MDNNDSSSQSSGMQSGNAKTHGHGIMSIQLLAETHLVVQSAHVATNLDAALLSSGGSHELIGNSLVKLFEAVIHVRSCFSFIMITVVDPSSGPQPPTRATATGAIECRGIWRKVHGSRARHFSHSFS